MRRPINDIILPWGGFFARFQEYASYSKAPPQFSFVAALAFIAAGFERPAIKWSVGDIYPNVYTLVVGASGTGKGTAQDLAQRVILPAVGAYILPNEGTPEGFLESMRRRYVNDRKPAGCDWTDGIILLEEMGTQITGEEKKKHSHLVFAKLYGHKGKYERALKSQPDYEFRNPFVSMYAGVQPEIMARMPQDALLGGFFPRFIIVDATIEEATLGRYMPDPDALLSLEEELRAYLTKLEINKLKGPIYHDKEALIWCEDWITREDVEFKKETVRGVRAWYSRLTESLMKTAVILQWSDGELTQENPYLRAEYMQRASQVQQYCKEIIRDLYGSLGVTRDGRCTYDVESYLKRHAEGEQSVSRVLRALKNKHKAAQIRQALGDLEAMGIVKTEARTISSVLDVKVTYKGASEKSEKSDA